MTSLLPGTSFRRAFVTKMPTYRYRRQWWRCITADEIVVGDLVLNDDSRCSNARQYFYPPVVHRV